MRKAVFAVAALSLASPALAQPTPASAVACHFVIRAYLGQGVAEAAGYFADIAGIPSDLLFNGPPSEKTAFLTFRSDLVTLTPLSANGVINLYNVSAGKFDFYFNQNPSGDWGDPDSFSGGQPFQSAQPVAQFMRPESLFYQTDTLARHDLTFYLESSRSFVLNGHSYDWGDIVPGGVTLYETYSNTPPPNSGITGFPVVFAGAGNCAAVGAAGENQQ